MRIGFWFAGVFGLTVGLATAACGSTTKCGPDDPRESCAGVVAYQAGSGANNGGSGGSPVVTSSKCLTTTPCTSDSQCVAIAGTSCNTLSNKCQTVLCGDPGSICSTDNHCKAGSRCASGACKYDPKVRCYSDPICIEGNWTASAETECKDMGGEIRASCPSGSNMECTYMEGNETVVMYFYSTSTSEELQFESYCMFLNGTIS